jgi:Kef-type K+ transport system membrane component KefB
LVQLDGHISLTLGLLLGAALAAGLLAERLRLPKVTAYLIVGLLLGPHTLESIPASWFDYLPRQLLSITTIPASHLHFLDPMARFAMALVLFNMGCGFTLRHLRPHWTSILRLSAGELSATFLLVTVGLILLRESWASAVLFAALALATAPATTVLVLKECRSEGPVTRYGNTLVALNNVASILMFEVLFVAILAMQTDSRIGIVPGLVSLCQNLAASVGVGLISGLGVSVGCVFFARSRQLVLLIAVTTAVLGICEQFQLPYLLTFLMMGFTVANTSDRAKDIVAQLDNLTGLLCVVFFVIHGTEMDLRALMAAGTIGAGYVVLRAAGKYFGIYLSARQTDGKFVKPWLGATLMSQAGAAIALSSIAAERYPEIGEHLRDIILGTVVFFEIAGPILIRRAVMSAGEVPLDSAIHHTESSIREELASMISRILMAFGFEPRSDKSMDLLTVSDLMRTNVLSIPASATYRRVVTVVERSHDDMLPVVDENRVVIGMISYHDLEDSHFDPGLGPLVRAADLVRTSLPVLHPDESLTEAWREFVHSKADCLPVAESERPYRLIGLLRRRDIPRAKK